MKCWFEREQVEAGIPFPPARARVKMLEESITFVRMLFGQEEATFRGEH